MSESKVNLSLTRRQFLKITAAAGIGVALAACSPEQSQKSKEARKPTLTPESRATPELKIRLGDEEMVSPSGLNWVPDGHISMLRMPGGNFRAWVQAGPISYLLEGSSLDQLGQPKLVFGPEKITTEKGFQGYRALHSVIPGVQPNELIGFYHQENWVSERNGFPYTASIGVAFSHDAGVTWEDQGTVIKGGQPEYPPENRASGAGQPSALIIDNWVHLYFIDWRTDSAAIHLTRAQIEFVQKPVAWQRWNGSDFGRFGDERASVPVILPPKDGAEIPYAALPGVSYNSFTNSYLTVFESNLGFYVATSKDAIHWDQAQILLRFPQPQFPIKDGNVWNSYPTLLSETDSDRQTDQTGWLLYSKGIRNQGPHRMYRRPFELG